MEVVRAEEAAGISHGAAGQLALGPAPGKPLRQERGHVEGAAAKISVRIPMSAKRRLVSPTRSFAPAPVVRPLALVSYRQYPDSVVADLVHERVREPGEH